MLVGMSEEKDDLDIYHAGYSAGYEQALASLSEFIDCTEKKNWSADLLLEILHVLINGSEEEIKAMLDAFEPTTLH